eukprot:m.216015 g.216015  ORF g.216015 m.216015 type:complete len:227 (+) comp19112_c0_seq11:166-846(+)
MVDNIALQEFLTHPQTIVRMLYILCTLVLFSVLTHDGEFSIPDPAASGTKRISVYNCDDRPLDFTIGIGIFGFLIGVFFLCAHLLNEISSSMVKYHSLLLKLDLVFTIFFCGLFFIAFCWTTNAWTGKNGICFEMSSNTVKFDEVKKNLSTSQKNGAQTGIAFSFLSTLLAGAIAYFCYSNIRSPLEDQQADGLELLTCFCWPCVCACSSSATAPLCDTGPAFFRC